jgi:hypothetical protein
MMEIKGSKMLKVTGILEIIFGIIVIIIGLLAAIGAAAITAGTVSTDTLPAGVSGGIVMFSAVLMLILGVVELIMGILGIKNCNNPQGAGKCFVFGIVVLALMVVSTILNIVAGSFQIYSLLGFVIPGLYTYGAFQVKSSK